jgi:hypothetical protein
MSKEIIKNPGDLPIIENPNKPSNTMANKTDQAFDELKVQLKNAAQILVGQAAAAQANAIIVPKALQTQSATTQQIARAGVPLAIGIIATMSSKNEYVRGLSLGFGTQGVLEGIKLLMPNFNPQDGLNDSSAYVFTDQNGTQHQGKVAANGEVVMPDGERMMLPQPQDAEDKKSKTMSEEEAEKELAGMGSDYTEVGVEYV